MYRTQAISEAAGLLIEAKKTLCLTGAGISVPSGIPDFRSKEGFWQQMDSSEWASIEAFYEDPARIWGMFGRLGRLIGTASPNPAHYALAQLERMNHLDLLVTQNVDGLHSCAGSRQVVEFHGSLARMTCYLCGWRGPTPAFQGLNGPPCCPSGHVPKPDVVLYGETLPRAAMDAALAAAAQADLIIVAGTSASAAPAADLPLLVKHNGGCVIEMNLTTSPLTPLADLSIFGDLSDTLPELLCETRGRIVPRR